MENYRNLSFCQVKEYKDELISKAEALITTGFPEKIVQLNELLATQMFADRNFHDVYQVRGPRKRYRCAFAYNQTFNEIFCFICILSAATQHSSAGCR